MTDHNATDAVSRRNVLKATGGLLTGATMLAGQSTAVADESLRFDVEKVTEEVIVASAYIPGAGGLNGFGIFLGHADRFVGKYGPFQDHEEEDTVSLPEDTDGLANPVEMEQLDEETYRMYFHTADIDFSEVEGEEVTLGLGVFPERTMPITYFDTDMVPAKPDLF